MVEQTFSGMQSLGKIMSHIPYLTKLLEDVYHQNKERERQDGKKSSSKRREVKGSPG